ICGLTLPASTFSNSTASLASLSGREGAAALVLHPERVERHAVRQRQDLGVDDVGAGQGERAGDAREQPGMVGGIERDLGNGAAQIDARVDGERRAAAL